MPIKRIFSGLGLLAALCGLAKAALGMPESVALGSANLLVAGLALGWVLRSVVHGLLRYFFPIEKPGVPRYRLMRLSILNALFAVAWLSAAITLIEHPDPVLSGVAIAVATCIAFLFSLRTHAAAEAAGLERGSEWMRAHLRGPLEPAARTVIGGPLVILLDWPSSKKRLSPYVAGSLAMLLVALILVAPGALRTIGSPNSNEGPGGNATRAPKIAPLLPAPPCGQTFSIRA